MRKKCPIIILINITSHVIIVDIYSCFIPLSFPLLSTSILADHSIFHDGTTQIFIPEGTGPLLVLSELSCSFSLTFNHRA